MVRIDARYVIPVPREVVWIYLTDPEREREYGWALHDGGNQILERRPDGVRFRGGRDRTSVGRRSFWSLFDGRFDRANWRIHWRILEGFEAGSEFVEELLEHPDGTEVRAHGEVRLNGVDWDQRLQAVFFPRAARATIERNLCRDYKALKTHLLTSKEAKEAPA